MRERRAAQGDSGITNYIFRETNELRSLDSNQSREGNKTLEERPHLKLHRVGGHYISHRLWTLKSVLILCLKIYVVKIW